ncbi:MAG: hydroxyectoine utilization dehydratase EutB [Candidatus Promineifilaceae bacterium]|nr:hydroxyectoine utilization dehydratase EutB [Candidatus Promineifilaceae bacterium]
MSTSITLQDIFTAQQTIQRIAHKTPLLRSEPLSAHLNVPVYLKLETMQDIGAFKIRGAANKMLNLSSDDKERGVVTASTGNHGRAVAYVAREIGLAATVCLSKHVPENKVAALRRLGAEVVIHGQSQDEAEVRAQELHETRGLVMIHPFDDADVIAGQGTIGLELLADLPDIDTVVVPLSGGGLIAGIALALKSANPAIRVVGVSMERAPAMYDSLQAGHPVQVDEEPTLADSLQGGIGLENRYTFRMAQHYVDEVILVSEAEIAAAMAFTLREHRLVVEGGGAVGIAAVQTDKLSSPQGKTALVLSGGNVDLTQLLEIVQRYG